jgi:hypothetical protein
MISRVLQIDLDEAEAGMSLADTLLDGHGGILLPQGTVLTEAMLNSLRRRGVEQVVVLNEHISAADLAAERERVERRLGQLFRKCKGEGASDLLLRSVKQYRLGADT